MLQYFFIYINHIFNIIHIKYIFNIVFKHIFYIYNINNNIYNVIKLNDY